MEYISQPIFTIVPKTINIIKLTAIVTVALIVSFVGFDLIRNSTNNETIPNPTVTSVTESKGSLRDSIVNYGMELLGTPYVEAGSDANGFDCSGFIYYVFNHFKIAVPRSSPRYEHFGKEVAIENVKKGDILVFLSPTNDSVIGHLGIVTDPKGMQSDFIHATSGRQMKVVITSLQVKGYKRRFVKAVSVIN